MRFLALLLTLAAGCSITTSKPPSEGSVGCCCTYGDCRERFTEHECASEGNFQGWTYTWHAGPCTENNTYPAVDRS